jgi:4-methyl-5(b-hydroxyethyl)-thiazole monophosphate biosynthesis
MNVLVCLAPGSEEVEAVTIIDLLVRAGLEVTTASVAGDGHLHIRCSRGVTLLADCALVKVADTDFAAIVLPGGLKGAECFRDSPLLVEKIRHSAQLGKIVAAICAAPALVLAHHQLFSQANMTGFPGLRQHIPQAQWREKRVVFDARFNLLTSQGPGTAMEFTLKLIDLLLGKDQAAEVARQLILAPGVYDYLD